MYRTDAFVLGLINYTAGMAISIFGRYPQLSHKADMRGNTPLNLLATSPSSFKSGSMYAFKNLGRRPFIPLQVIVILLYLCKCYFYMCMIVVQSRLKCACPT